MQDVTYTHNYFELLESMSYSPQFAASLHFSFISLYKKLQLA